MENNSMLPQPTARPGGILRALAEVSDSDHNTRNGMLPPPHTGLKRPASGLPEPAPKRKTLVERAGEPIRSTSNHARSTSSASHYGIPHSALSSYRNNSSISTTSSRTASSHSRTTSASSVTGYGGSSLRPPSSHAHSGIGRPKSALAKDRGTGLHSRLRATPEDQDGSLEIHKEQRKDPFLSPYIPSWTTPRTPSLDSARPGHAIFSGWMMNRRDTSLTSHFEALSLNPAPQQSSFRRRGYSRRPKSPSKIPRPETPPRPITPIPFKNIQSRVKRTSSPKKAKYLTTDSNLENFDPDEPYQDLRRIVQDLYQDTVTKAQEAREENNIFRETLSKLEQDRALQTENIIALKSENQTLKYRIENAEQTASEQRKEHDNAIEELKHSHRTDSDTMRQENRRELEQSKEEYRQEIKDLKRKHDEELSAERSQRIEALSQVSTQGALEQQRHQMDLNMKDQDVKAAQAEIERVKATLEREMELNDDLRKNLSTAGDNAMNMEAARQALQAKVAYLESDSKSQSEAYAEMERRMNEALEKAVECEDKLRKEESLRRKLHNQVQELKGNIRVFCRVRPTLSTEEELTKMKYPDPEESTEIEVKGLEETNSLGKVTTKSYPFTFDRVFEPTAGNTEVFDEISQLIQSALDGYNVCIFAYGQTGSGKTFTMSSEDGMIPRALRQIYSTSKELEGRGWKYSMEGSFVEVYNEDIRDLLGNDDRSTRKHEIRHDMSKCETTITDVSTLTLDSQDQVEGILSQAMARRSVAATSANERSSRSHSVFILKLVGENSITGEKSKGTLNLVDLAGSERLSQSKVEGQRLKETQSINKSLSCLGDVIGALGQQQLGSAPTFDGRSSVNGAAAAATTHIPYRNSKLTYLLQFSLGGNSKTLMFVMVAPEKKCLSETITSLKFAEKVARTKVGVAKKVK